MEHGVPSKLLVVPLILEKTCLREEIVDFAFESIEESW